jgi:hypothetical protein
MEIYPSAGTCINSKFMARKDVDNCFSNCINFMRRTSELDEGENFLKTDVLETEA